MRCGWCVVLCLVVLAIPSFINAHQGGPTLVPRIMQEDIFGNDIYEQVKKTLMNSQNPAAIDRVRQLLSVVKDQLLNEQVDADHLYEKHRSIYIPKIQTWNTTIDEIKQWISDADSRVKQNQHEIESLYEFLDTLPDKMILKREQIAEQERLLHEWLIPRQDEVYRFSMRLTDAKDTLVGINFIADKLGKLNKEHYNTTLTSVLNDHHTPVASLLETVAKLPVDDLDEFRLMIRLMMEQMHAYVQDLMVSEQASNEYFFDRKKNLTDTLDAEYLELNNMTSANITALENIRHLKNETVNLQVARVTKFTAQNKAERHREKLIKHVHIVTANWERQKKARDSQLELVAKAHELIEQRLHGQFVPVAPASPTTNDSVTATAPVVGSRTLPSPPALTSAVSGATAKKPALHANPDSTPSQSVTKKATKKSSSKRVASQSTTNNAAPVASEPNQQ